MIVSNQLRKINNQNKKIQIENNETKNIPWKNINVGKPENRPARERKSLAGRKRSVTSQRNFYKSMQVEKKRRQKNSLMKKRDPEEMERLRNSGNPAKLRNPRHDDFKLQQETTDISRSKTERLRKKETGIRNSGSTWNHDVKDDVINSSRRKQLKTTMHSQNHENAINEKTGRIRNSGNTSTSGSSENSILEIQMEMQNNTSDGRSMAAGSLKSGGAPKNQ